METKKKNEKAAVLQIASALIWASMIIVYSLSVNGNTNSYVFNGLIIGAALQMTLINYSQKKKVIHE